MPRFFKSREENISRGPPKPSPLNLCKLSRIFPRTPIAAYIYMIILYYIILYYIQYNICTHVEFWYETRGTGSSNSQDAATATVAGRTSLSMVCIMDRNSMNFWVMLSCLFIHSEIRCKENQKRWLIPQGIPQNSHKWSGPFLTAVPQNLRYSLNAALNMVQEERARRWCFSPKKWLATTRRNHGGNHGGFLGDMGWDRWGVFCRKIWIWRSESPWEVHLKTLVFEW